MSSSSTKGSPVFIGPLPNPVTGQTISTQALLEYLVKAGLTPIVRNSVRGDSKNRLSQLAIRKLRFGRALGTLLLVRLKGKRAVYISVDANAGMLLTSVSAALSRLLGHRVYLHYHSFSHLEKSTPLMSLLAFVVGNCGTHVSICQFMSDRLKKLYPRVRLTAELSNAHTIQLPPRPKVPDRANEQTFVIGFLGRLTREKGAYLALEVLEALLRQGTNVKLILGGPMIDSGVNEAALRVMSNFGEDKIELTGMLRGQQIAELYQRLDAFLFPTTFVNETQGIVNLEAMSHGVPVIAYGRCCVPTDVGSAAGIVVDPSDEFVSPAVAAITNWLANPLEHKRASIAARQRFIELQAQSKQQLDWLVSQLS